MYYIDIILVVDSEKINRFWTYKIDKEQYQTLQLGSSVFVDFKGQKIIGYALHKYEDQNKDSQKYKQIIKIGQIDVLNQYQKELFKIIDQQTISNRIDIFNLFLSKKQRKSLIEDIDIEQIKLPTRIFIKGIVNDAILTPRQKEIIDVINCQEIELSVLKCETGASDAIIKTLENKGCIRRYQKEINYQLDFDFSNQKSNELTKLQKQVVDKIKLNDKNILYGVIASGKTEVYLELIKEAINNDEQILLIEPEIHLAKILVSKLQALYGDTIIYYHQKLNQNKILDYNKRIKDNKIKIVIGSMESIFLPFENLNMIIIDEFHDQNYRYNKKPFYDLLKIVNELNKKILLGSGTPLINTVYDSKKNGFNIIKMNKRFYDVEKPVINISSVEPKMILNDQTINLISEALSKDENIIIYYNNIGYSDAMFCDSCGHIETCPNCDISLKYFDNINKYSCNYCGYTKNFKNSCSYCRKKDGLIPLGFGIDKIKEELNVLFDCGIIQLDKTILEKEKTLDTTITKLIEAKRSIILGDDVLIKGLDVLNTSLAVVVNSDELLFSDNIYGREILFDKLVQFIGRAGRNNNATINIQTMYSDNNNWDIIKGNDYDSFYTNEINYRKEHMLIPFVKMAKIVIKNKTRDGCLANYMELVKIINKYEVEIVESHSDFVFYGFLLHKKHLFIKYHDENAMKLFMKIKMKFNVDIMIF